MVSLMIKLENSINRYYEIIIIGFQFAQKSITLDDLER